MKPFLHTKNSVKKYGGKPEDYSAIHNFFDQTKAVIPDMRHRAILHNSFGIFLAEQVFGELITNSDGFSVSVRDIGEDHVLEDMGTIPTLQDYFENFKLERWFGGTHHKKKKVEEINMEDFVINIKKVSDQNKAFRIPRMNGKFID